MQFRSQLLRRNTHQTHKPKIFQDYGYSSLIPITWEMLLTRLPSLRHNALLCRSAANPSGYLDVSMSPSVRSVAQPWPILGHPCWQRRRVRVRCHLINKKELIAAIRDFMEIIVLAAMSSQITGRCELVTQDTLLVRWPLVTTTLSPARKL